MFVEAEIIVPARQRWPSRSPPSGRPTATADRAAGADGVVERVAVETGIRDGGWIEIVPGLTGGDLVVAKAGAFVRAGDRITPVAVATN
jgi:HlyD family secretion protein